MASLKVHVVSLGPTGEDSVEIEVTDEKVGGFDAQQIEDAVKNALGASRQVR